MRVGVTGSRSGFSTGAQQTSLYAILSTLRPDQLHHGDCVGVDVAAATYVDDWCKTEAHPPLNDKYRAWHESDVVHDPDEYLIRNRDIVHAVQLLIVVPMTRTEQVRSGTWATYRYAKDNSTPVLIINIDGSVQYEG